jgi:hypothetical protein
MNTKFNEIVVETNGVRTVAGGGTGTTTLGSLRDSLQVLPLSGGTLTGNTQINANLTVIGNVSATGSYFGDGSKLTGMLELGNLQIPDVLASVIANVYGPTSPVELQLDGTYNGKPRYTGSFDNYNYSVLWSGTNWQAPAGSLEADYNYGDSIATGDTQYPWQATGWTNGGFVTRVGTYNATLAPTPLSAYAYSGISTKAAREDHVHPLPTEANSWNSAYTTVQTKSATEWNNSLVNSYTHANFLPLTGGIISANSSTNALTVVGNISATQNYFSGENKSVFTPQTNTVGVSAVSNIVVVSVLPVTPDPSTLYIIT